MFVAHLPAGYLASHVLAGDRENRPGLIATGLVASILPDTDLLWFYLVDNRQTLHHEYVFHWPLFWTALALVGAVVAVVLKKRAVLPYIGVALICLLLHMLLDSFAAEIYWLKPLSDFHLNAVVVPARYGWWVWNFVFHWSFAVELLICLAAAVVLVRRRKAAG